MKETDKKIILALFFAVLIALYCIAFIEEMKNWYELKNLENNHNEPTETARVRESIKDDSPRQSEAKTE